VILQRVEMMLNPTRRAFYSPFILQDTGHGTIGSWLNEGYKHSMKHLIEEY
jgi:hypothetical protein